MKHYPKLKLVIDQEFQDDSTQLHLKVKLYKELCKNWGSYFEEDSNEPPSLSFLKEIKFWLWYAFVYKFIRKRIFKRIGK